MAWKYQGRLPGGGVGPSTDWKQYREGDGVSGRGFIGTMIKSKRKLLV